MSNCNKIWIVSLSLVLFLKSNVVQCSVIATDNTNESPNTMRREISEHKNNPNGQTTHILLSKDVDDDFWQEQLGEDFKTAVFVDMTSDDNGFQLADVTKNNPQYEEEEHLSLNQQYMLNPRPALRDVYAESDANKNDMTLPCTCKHEHEQIGDDRQEKEIETQETHAKIKKSIQPENTNINKENDNSILEQKMQLEKNFNSLKFPALPRLYYRRNEYEINRYDDPKKAEAVIVTLPGDSKAFEINENDGLNQPIIVSSQPTILNKNPESYGNGNFNEFNTFTETNRHTSQQQTQNQKLQTQYEQQHVKQLKNNIQRYYTQKNYRTQNLQQKTNQHSNPDFKVTTPQKTQYSTQTLNSSLLSPKQRKTKCQYCMPITSSLGSKMTLTTKRPALIEYSRVHRSIPKFYYDGL